MIRLYHRRLYLDQQSLFLENRPIIALLARAPKVHIERIDGREQKDRKQAGNKSHGLVL
jgi:hypothetical protein